MPQYYRLRRVPQSIPRAYLWRKLLPLVGPITRSSIDSLVAKVPLSSATAKQTLEERARESGDAVAEKAQRIFFENPGLDTMAVRVINRLGATWIRIGRASVLARVWLGRDKDGRLLGSLKRIPLNGYDSVMVSALAAGTALGYFRGGTVHSLMWWDSSDGDQADGGEGVSEDADRLDPGAESRHRELPPGHPYPGVRRFNPPQTLGDLAADIDDLYWANAYGEAIKITRVGQDKYRRWLVSLPGTDHPEFESRPNVADLESNIREELNLPSAMRVGTIKAICNAMQAEGLTAEEMVSERVLICGHSQGGMVATALASAAPKDVGFSVDAVLTLGSPNRRLLLRPDSVALVLEHSQDIVPSLDGTPRRKADQRLVVERNLTQPKKDPLFYAHSSSTYTETVRQVERFKSVLQSGRLNEVVAHLQSYLPAEGEECRVTHHYVWQELLDPTKMTLFESYLDLGESEKETNGWEPVAFDGDIGVKEIPVVTPDEIAARASEISTEIAEKASALLRLGKSVSTETDDEKAGDDDGTAASEGEDS